MSRITVEDENGVEKIIIIDYEECRYKTNGTCYSNADWKKLGKKCLGCEGGKRWKERKLLRG